MQRKKRFGVLGAQRYDLRLTRVDAVAIFEFIDAGRKRHRVPRMTRLWQHDAGRLSWNDRLQIGFPVLAIDGIDAHPDVPLANQVVRGHLSRRRLRRGRDGVFEVENERIGTRTARFLQLAPGIGRHEQETATHAGFLSMSAVRLHSPTSLSSWL